VSLEPVLVSVPEAARMLSISVRHAWNLIADGKLPSVRLGRRVLVPKRQLLALLDALDEEEHA
jgi:excisionase family DNA binding protein